MKYRGFDICKQNRVVDGMKQHPYIIPALRRCGSSMKDAKQIIDNYKGNKWIIINGLIIIGYSYLIIIIKWTLHHLLMSFAGMFIKGWKLEHGCRWNILIKLVLYSCFYIIFPYPCREMDSSHLPQLSRLLCPIIFP